MHQLPVFPILIITLIADKPTFATIKHLKSQAYNNAMSQSSTCGGGAHGLLGAIMPPKQYQLISQGGVIFNAPIAPPAAPVHPAGVTGQQITEINRQWTADQDEYQKYITVLAALTQQILLKVPSTYYATIADPVLAYANVTSLQLLHHLTTTYGLLDRREIQSNEKRLNNEWSTNTPIED